MSEVTNSQAISDWIATADSMANLDLIIANAGVSGGTFNGKEPTEQVRQIFDVNLGGVLNTVLPGLDRMLERQAGQIAIISSLASFLPLPAAPAYSASKGGVVGMTLPIARDLARMGIRINTIAPGIFNTPLMNGAPDSVKNPLIEMVQFPKRLGHPEDFASLTKHIVENSYLNGETIRIDGSIRMAPK